MSASSRSLAVVLAAVLLTAGCLGGTPSTGTDTATQTPTATELSGTSTPTATEMPGTPTPTPDPTPGETATDEWTTTERASEQPDPDKAIHVENRWNQSVEIRTRVVREATNETVYDETETFEPGADRDVYNLADADPDGIESFRVTATARNATESVTIETHECHGNAYVEITENGELYPYYAIC
jgi:ABC-type glycerol-3-phosphate transport system substrate-binding protein